MNFKDAQLQKWYDWHLSEATDASEDQRQVHALIATHGVFLMLDGPHSERVHEMIEHLLSAQMRPGLRRWYQRSDAGTDSTTIEFRDLLSQLAEERFEGTSESSRKLP